MIQYSKNHLYTLKSDWRYNALDILRISIASKGKKHLLYFFIFLLFHPFAYSASFSKNQTEAPAIICLKGTCSSGKSTFIASINAEFDDFVIVDEDSIVFKKYPEAIAKKFPDKFTAVSKAVNEQNLYHTLRTEDVFFKENATENERIAALKAIKNIKDELNRPESLAWKKEVSQNITDDVLKNIELAIQQNKNVILDAWYVSPEHIQKLHPKNSTIKVLLYCSLPVAYKRLLRRNEEAMTQGLLFKKRLIGQLLGSFYALYDVNHHSTDAIEEVNTLELGKTLHRIKNELLERAPTKKPIFTFQEISLNEFEKIFANLKTNSNGFNSGGLYINSKEDYDLIINNTYSNPSEALEQLENFLYFYHSKELRLSIPNQLQESAFQMCESP